MPTWEVAELRTAKPARSQITYEQLEKMLKKDELFSLS
jgi:hypothetical protein